jgi:hypothetical protein
MIARSIAAHVQPARWGSGEPGGRVGTVFASTAELENAFGAPGMPGSGDGKASAGWAFETPRGHASLYVYWWNGADEFSIGAPRHKAWLWLAALLRRRGFRARCRRWPEFKP